MPEAVIRFPEGRFEGQVNDQKDPEGEGVLEFPGNDEQQRQSYEGQFKAKKAHGYGIMRWTEGDKYEGDWQEGLRHGKGVYTSKLTGAKYEGDYANDLKHGQGKYTYANGDVYDGEWQNGLRHGTGKYSYKEDAGVYVGNWVNGIKQGLGTYTFGTGDVFSGEYDNNVRHGSGELKKVDGEERTETWKEGKLLNFKINKEKSA